MLAKYASLYSDDLARFFRKMAGRSTLHPNVPSGYGSFYNKATGLPNPGFFGAATAREVAAGKKGFGFYSRPMRGISGGIESLHGNFGKLGIMGILGAGLLESYTAPRGHKVTHLTKGLISGVAFALGDVAGTVLSGGNLIAGFAAGVAFERGGSYVGDMIDKFSDFNRSITHVNMGGNYEDTRIAYTMRQRAAQEMGSSVMNARQWLGKEALLLHQ